MMKLLLMIAIGNVYMMCPFSHYQFMAVVKRKQKKGYRYINSICVTFLWQITLSTIYRDEGWDRCFSARHGG